MPARVSDAWHLNHIGASKLHRAGISLATPKQDVFHAAMPQRQFDARSQADRVTLLERVELFAGLTAEE